MASKISVCFVIAITLILFSKRDAYMICPNGHVCEDNDEQICCPPVSTHITEPVISVSSTLDAQKTAAEIAKEYWYTGWILCLVAGVFVILISLCICCLYHCVKRYMSVVACYCECCQPRNPRTPSEHGSAGSCCQPPRYSRCSSLYRMPPAYSEVTSKPDLYPLVITCNNDKGYLMVQYFRNNPNSPNNHECTLSATSTAESINSSNLCNTANEANSIVPPPYSFASPEDRRPEGQWTVHSKSTVNTPPRFRPPSKRFLRTYSETSPQGPEIRFVDDDIVLDMDPFMRSIVLSEGGSPNHVPRPHHRTDSESDTESNASAGDNPLSPTFYQRAGLFFVPKKNDVRRGLVGVVNQVGYKLRVTSAPTTPDDVYILARTPFRPRRGNFSAPKLHSRQKGEDEPLVDDNE